jgi:hypothetical protein
MYSKVLGPKLSIRSSLVTENGGSLTLPGEEESTRGSFY